MFDHTTKRLEHLSDEEKNLVLGLQQPFTAKQLARKHLVTPTRSSALLERMNAMGLVRCLNSYSRSSRLYFPTLIGDSVQRDLSQDVRFMKAELPKLDWYLYGSLCFNHRSAVFRRLSLDRPMQSSEIKRRLRIEQPEIRISANNIRDVIRTLKEHGLVEEIYIRKKAHPRFVLSTKAVPYQKLLKRAEVVG